MFFSGQWHMRLWLCLSILSSCHIVWAANPQTPWTVLVYLAAANSLSSFATYDLREMIKVGSNQNVNIIVYLTVFNDDGSKVTKRLFIEKGTMKQIGATTKEDSGSVDTLMRALNWMIQDYPADHYCTIVWNHGSGILNRSDNIDERAVCYDDDTGHYLSDRDCLKAFSWAKDTLNNGNNIDIIAFDACLMNMLECAFTLSSCCNFMVGSETTIPGDGYEYARIFNSFVRGIPAPRDLAKIMVKVYQEAYANTPDYALSAVDESQISKLVDNFNQIASELISALQGPRGPLAKKALQTSAKVTSFGDGTYLDMLNFYVKLASQVPSMGLAVQKKTLLMNLLQVGQVLISKVVFAHVTSIDYRHTGGLSFYFPQDEIDPSYYTLYWTEKNPLFLQLLEAYLGAQTQVA